MMMKYFANVTEFAELVVFSFPCWINQKRGTEWPGIVIGVGYIDAYMNVGPIDNRNQDSGTPTGGINIYI